MVGYVGSSEGRCQQIKVSLIGVRYSFNSSMEKGRRPRSIEEVVEGAVDNIFRKYDENNNDFIDYP